MLTFGVSLGLDTSYCSVCRYRYHHGSLCSNPQCLLDTADKAGRLAGSNADWLAPGLCIMHPRNIMHQSANASKLSQQHLVAFSQVRRHLLSFSGPCSQRLGGAEEAGSLR